MSSVVALKPKKRKTPTTEIRKVPRRPMNADVRSREYLTPGEVEKLMAAAGEAGRYGHRDATLLLLLAYRHGLRVSELVSLRWDQVDLKHGLLHVKRIKNGTPSTHPLRGPELRALRKLQREQTQDGGYAFTSERGGPMTTDNVRKMMQRAGKRARISFPVHPHMLRHATGYKLANDGHDTRAIQHTWGTRTFSTPFGTRSLRRRGSRFLEGLKLRSGQH